MDKHIIHNHAASLSFYVLDEQKQQQQNKKNDLWLCVLRINCGDATENKRTTTRRERNQATKQIEPNDNKMNKTTTQAHHWGLRRDEDVGMIWHDDGHYASSEHTHNMARREQAKYI